MSAIGDCRAALEIVVIEREIKEKERVNSAEAGIPAWSKISQDDYIDFLVSTANQQNIVCYFCGKDDFVVLNDAEHCAIFVETTLQSPLYFLGVRCRTCGTLYKHSLDVVTTTYRSSLNTF